MITVEGFYDRVAARLPETIEVDGEEATHAVLSALTARLTPEEAAELGAELPAELGDILAEASGAHPFTRDDLLEDVAAQLDIDDDEAEGTAIAVLAVVREVLEPVTTIEQVLEALPSDLAQLMQ